MSSRRLRIVSLLAGLSFVQSVLSDSAFSTPGPPGDQGDFSDNKLYKVGDSIDVKWQTDLKKADLFLYRTYPDREKGDYYLGLIKDTSFTSYDWTVSLDQVGIDIPDGEDYVLHFELFPAGAPDDDDWDAWSHYFNVTNPKAATTTTSAATSTATTTTATQGKSTETNGSGSEDSSDSGLSAGATAGIAVGATIAGLVILGALGFLFWRRRKRAGAKGNPQELDGNSPEYKAVSPNEQDVSRHPPVEMVGSTPSPALHSAQGPHEVPG